MRDNNFFLPLLSGFFIAYIFLADNNKVIQEKTVYFEYCDDFKHNSFSCPTKTIVAKAEFMIFTERQIVVSNTLTPQTYEKCSIFDKNNWKCDKGEGKFIGVSNSAFFESNNGSLGKDSKPSSLPLGSQIPVYIYYIRSIIDFIKTLLG